jgi:hypothetical protein
MEIWRGYLRGFGMCVNFEVYMMLASEAIVAQAGAVLRFVERSSLGVVRLGWNWLSVAYVIPELASHPSLQRYLLLP